MKNRNRSIARICAVAALMAIAASAAYGSEEPVKTVDWFKEHNAERADAIAKYTNNPGEMRNNPNCINAIRAQGIVDLKKPSLSRKLVPLTAEQFQKK